MEEQLKHMTTESPIQNPYSDKGTCPYCGNSGWELIVIDGIEYAKDCRCGIRKRDIHKNRLRFADIPEAFKDVRLENFKKSVYTMRESQEKIIEAAKAVRYWIQNLDDMKKRGIGLYFYSGTKGTGKTRLAISIANELIYKYHTQVKFSTSIRILEEIKRTWDFSTEKSSFDRFPESDLMSAFRKAAVLIIDDFGAEIKKSWIDEKFYSIIDGRYTGKKITIFTSNMKLEDLPYDERITNRIKERVLQVPFPEESVRNLLAEQLHQELLEGMKIEE